MKKQYFEIYTVCVLIFGACSSQRYTYNFDYYDYNSGRRAARENLSTGDETNPIKLSEENMVASTNPGIAFVPDKSNSVPKSTSLQKQTSVAIHDLSKSERRHLKQEFKNYLKDHSKQLKTESPQSVEATKQLDDELKLAIIFGAIGVTFAILGGINTVFWVLGVISLVVGLVFFIRWISTQ